MIKKYFFVSALACALAACSSTDDIDESLLPAELIDFEASVGIDEIWSVDLGTGANETSSLLRPVVLGDQIYASDYAGRVSARNVSDGERQWLVNLRTDISGGAGVGDGLVLVASADGVVYALEQSDGSIRWQKQFNGEILTAPQAGFGVTVVFSQDGRVTALDSLNGENLWHADTDKPLLTVRGNAQPTIVDNIVLIGQDSGKIAAYRLEDGATIWIARVGIPEGSNELQRMVDIDAAPLYANGLVYGLSFQSGIMAIDPQTGRGAWFQESSSVSEIGLFGGTLAIADVDSKITAFSAVSGQLLWESDVIRNRQTTGPIVHEQAVAVADFEGYVHLFRRNTGAFANRIRVGRAAVRSPLIPIEDGFLVFDIEGRLTALKFDNL